MKYTRRRLIFLLIFIFSVVVMFVGYSENDVLHSWTKELQRNFGTRFEPSSWLQEPYSFCGGTFAAYAHQFAVLKNVILKPNDSSFYIPCNNVSDINYKFDFGKEGTHLNNWLKNLKHYQKEVTRNITTLNHNEIVIAILRYEYANLYHTMTDWYNVFLVCKLLNISIGRISILWFSQNAKGHLDQTWATLFRRIIKRTEMKESLFFETVVWNVLGYESPLNYHGLLNLPFVDEFSQFFLQRHQIYKTKLLNCQKVSIFFLWRRDYVAHPGNMKGIISRKIQNEQELLLFFKTYYPSAEVRGEQLDKLSFREQLSIISSTDILISMHGAGLCHTLFLPSHAGIVELFTVSWTSYGGLTHFKSMARWRGLRYTTWQNLNPTNELTEFSTYIPPWSLQQKVNYIYRQLCP